MHCRFIHLCFLRPGPPNTGISRQNLHTLQFPCKQPVHTQHSFILFFPEITVWAYFSLHVHTLIVYNYLPRQHIKMLPIYLFYSGVAKLVSYLMVIYIPPCRVGSYIVVNSQGWYCLFFFLSTFISIGM